MPEAKPTETEIIELSEEFASRFPHLSQRRHYKLVRAGYGNYFARDKFEAWYERTVPLLTPEMVETTEDIHCVLRHDSYLVPEGAARPLYQLLRDAA